MEAGLALFCILILKAFILNSEVDVGEGRGDCQIFWLPTKPALSTYTKVNIIYRVFDLD